MTPNLSKQFVENLVKEPIADFTIQPGCKVGDNVAGQLFALQIKTVSGKTHNLVFKTLGNDDYMFSQFMRLNRTFALEIGMYTIVKSSLENLIKCQGQDLSLPFPSFYGGVCDGENDFLCLEDLRVDGFLMPNKYSGLTATELKVVLQELGKFHAITYSLIKYEGEKYFERNDEVLAKLKTDTFSIPEVQKEFTLIFGNALNLSIDYLYERDKELAEKIRDAFDMSKLLQDSFLKVTRWTDAYTFPVIIHGDFWMNNILLKYNDEGNPIAAKFVDFQQSRRGNIYEELLYFVYTSTTPAVRANHLTQSLRVYYDTFLSTVTGLKIPLPSNFTFGSFMDMFNDGMRYAYLYTTFAIPLQLGNLSDPYQLPEGEKSLSNVLSVGHLKHLMDNSPRAIDRLVAISREFVDLNVLK